MDNDDLKQGIDGLIAVLGDETNIARPTIEHEVVDKIRQLLDNTREQRTGSAREVWEYYLPYAVKLCYQLSRLEEGWEDHLDYFASENAQFWLDNAVVLIEQAEITGGKNALGQILEAARGMKRDRIAQVDILLQALDIAFEINDKKRTTQLYEEAEKVYRKYLITGSEYTGSAWLPKIKKMGQRLGHFREKLRRYFHYAETVTVSIEADSESDLERVIDYLQQNLAGKVKVTRRPHEDIDQVKPAASHYKARLKITMGS
jgi:hypothetical protein